MKQITLILPAVFILAICSSCHAATFYYDFVVAEATFTRLCNTKSMLVVNGEFPGPTITVSKGDTFFVNVQNQASYGITIHWHGVKQPRNPWSDGPENITQCPIQPGTNFTYQVILSNEEGTLWWHAHNDWTRASVHGAIVVLPPNNEYHEMAAPYHYQTLILGSWFNSDARDVALQNYAAGTDPPAPDANLINGQPGDLYTCSSDSTYTLTVDAGMEYLLRVINCGVNDEQWFGVANHKLTVVGQDGAYVKPFTTDYVMITPGQTMDLMITADQAPGYYYMATSVFSDFDLAPFNNVSATAILVYSGDVARPSVIPFPTLPGAADDVAASDFTALIKSMDSYGHPFDLPQTVDQDMLITISTNFLDCTSPSCVNPFAFAASTNNVSFLTNPISILQAYYNNVSGIYTDDFPSNPPEGFDYTGDVSGLSPYTTQGTRVKTLNYNDKVQIVFQGTNILSAGNHPMHIHGYSFYLVGKGTGNYNSVTDPQSFDLVNAPLINTFGVPKNGWIALRFVANNPGVWFIHCHIDKHALWGMQTVLIVKNGDSADTSMIDPPLGMPECSA